MTNGQRTSKGIIRSCFGQNAERLPSVVQVELRRKAGRLGHGALLRSHSWRLGRSGGWRRRATRSLARLGRRLAGRSCRLTRLEGRLAGVHAHVAELDPRAGLRVGTLLLGHRALLLRAGSRLGTCSRQSGTGFHQ